MNRNSYQGYSSNLAYPPQSHKTVTSNFRASATGFNQSRTPLYPIGPTLTQPQFKPMPRGTSPYLSRQTLRPPSYEQRYLPQAQAARGYEASRMDYEMREKEIIARSENEIEEEHKRRDQIRVSFEREIASKSNALTRNMERKQRLLAEISALEHTHSQLHDKAMSLKPPPSPLNDYEPLDRKQQEMIITKNKLLSQMREKEMDLHKEVQEEEKYWVDQVADKEKTLLRLETELNSKRIELNTQKYSLERPDLASIEEQVRQEKYEDFIFESEEVESKIARLVDERQRISSEVTQAISVKKPMIHNQALKHEDLAREKEDLSERFKDLERLGKEMEQANGNLLEELSRKESMIVKYEEDIQALKDSKLNMEYEMGEMFKKARQEGDVELIPGLPRQISTLQEDLRIEMSTTTRLKTQYQRLYELLCSSTTKNIHQTFNTLHQRVQA